MLQNQEILNSLCNTEGSHVVSVFAFFFDLCHHVLENANVKREHHYLLP